MLVIIIVKFSILVADVTKLKKKMQAFNINGEYKCPMFLAAQGTNPYVGVTCSDRNIGQRSIC